MCSGPIAAKMHRPGPARGWCEACAHATGGDAGGGGFCDYVFDVGGGIIRHGANILVTGGL